MLILAGSGHCYLQPRSQCTLFASQILHKLLMRNALGNMQTSQEYFTTIVYAKFGEQTECIMDNWKIVNGIDLYHAAAILDLKRGWTGNNMHAMPSFEFILS